MKRVLVMLALILPLAGCTSCSRWNNSVKSRHWTSGRVLHNFRHFHICTSRKRKNQCQHNKYSLHSVSLLLFQIHIKVCILALYTNLGNTTSFSISYLYFFSKITPSGDFFSKWCTFCTVSPFTLKIIIFRFNNNSLRKIHFFRRHTFKPFYPFPLLLFNRNYP